MRYTKKVAGFLGMPFLFIVILTSNSLGQVATPSMDTSIPVKLSAAVAWRDKSVLGAVATQGTSEGQQDGGIISSSWSSVSYLGGGNITGIFFTEVFQTIENREQEWALSYGGSVDISYKTKSVEENNQANFAFDFEAFSLGLTYNSSKMVEEFELKYDGLDVGTEYDVTTETRTDRLSYGLSGGMRFMDLIYIGIGAIQVNDKPASRVNNSWVNLLGGIALYNEVDSTLRFRIEVSRITSPESIKNGDSNDPENVDANAHYATVENINSLEIGLRNIRTVLRLENSDKETTSSETVSTHQTHNTIGGIYTLQNGLAIGLYQVIGSEKLVLEDSTGEEHSQELSDSLYYRLSLSYNY